MRFFKGVVLVLVLALSLVGSSFAGTSPEWRPFKLGLGPSTPFAAADPGVAPTFEITLLGGFASGFGILTAESLASDLLTGRSSPYYGKGFTDFFWSPYAGYSVPTKLDTAVSAPMLNKDSGALAGVKLGFNISPSIQVEAFFQYQFSGYSIDDALFAQFHDSWNQGSNILKAFFGNSTLMDNSVQKAGKTIMAGLNFNLCFPSGGALVPYISLGAGIFSVSDFPTISLSETHTAGASVMYGMDIVYTSSTALLFNGGAGLKYYLGPNYGLKIEARANMAPISLNKNLTTSFSGSSAYWTQYTPYSAAPALIEKGTGFFVSGVLGFFYGF